MQNIFVKECKDCNEIELLVSSIDKKIKEETTALLYNKKYLTDKKVDKRLVQDLTYYKQIATNLYWDSNFYSPDFNRTQIISQIKEKLAGTKAAAHPKKPLAYYIPPPEETVGGFSEIFALEFF